MIPASSEKAEWFVIACASTALEPKRILLDLMNGPGRSKGSAREEQEKSKGRAVTIKEEQRKSEGRASAEQGKSSNHKRRAKEKQGMSKRRAREE